MPIPDVARGYSNPPRPRQLHLQGTWSALKRPSGPLPGDTLRVAWLFIKTKRPRAQGRPIPDQGRCRSAVAARAGACSPCQPTAACRPPPAGRPTSPPARRSSIPRQHQPASRHGPGSSQCQKDVCSIRLPLLPAAVWPLTAAALGFGAQKRRAQKGGCVLSHPGMRAGMWRRLTSCGHSRHGLAAVVYMPVQPRLCRAPAAAA